MFTTLMLSGSTCESLQAGVTNLLCADATSAGNFIGWNISLNRIETLVPEVKTLYNDAV